MASKSDDYIIALAQYIKARRFAVRQRYSLMADAEIARSVGSWKVEFERRAQETPPQVLDLESEARRRLGA